MSQKQQQQGERPQQSQMDQSQEKSQMDQSQEKSQGQQNAGPDNPSKHSPNEPANMEPHRESGSGRHEVHP